MRLRKIKILETDKNRKGDLFSRLMGDLFYSLGYNEPRYDVHKSGREIDITTTHRTESKVAYAECKAHEATIGGDDINKFVGSLDVERKKLNKEKTDLTDVVGYFISLSGFKQTAIEQENEVGNNRVILLEPDKIVKELIAGKIIVSIEKAVSCIKFNEPKTRLADFVDLFAHERGWIWVIYYTNGQEITHYTFIHAEGLPLINELAKEITLANFEFNNLIFISHNDDSYSLKNTEEIKNRYYKYIKNECGEIHFDGLPIDKESGSAKVDLESIFVPLHLQELDNANQNNRVSKLDYRRVEIGNVLSINKKIAILARPGGGKSTLIKRIAVAYAYPERRLLVNDNLPDIDLVPIFIRCRELGDLAQSSITDIINSIPNRAELGHLRHEFSYLVSESLQKGNALILIDGLDEISEERKRILFVNQLRVFLATYPNLYVIITSREVGFRSVSGALAGYCSHYNLASLSNAEIIDLCNKWHKAIIDNSINTLSEAESLAKLIIKDTKILILARNPLLLTTLLFVKRWVGYLPTRRNVLYQEMIKLLLVTWNVEGYEQLDIDETEPQLAYVAFWMTQNKQQTITYNDLKNCLKAARTQMPDILDYTKISVSEFIKRVESRSSLLIMSGHQRTQDGLMPVYEFLHLSFQEYLAAKAIAERYLPGSENRKSFLDIIDPYIMEPNWKEVIPLLSVLLKRQSKTLIEYLITKIQKAAIDYPYNVDEEESEDATNSQEVSYKNSNYFNKYTVPKLLGNCLANEIQITPDTLDSAFEWYIKCIDCDQETHTIDIILNSKFSYLFKKKIINCFFDEFHNQYTIPLGDINAKVGLIHYKNPDEDSALNSILESVFNSTDKEKCIALLSLMQYAFESSHQKKLVFKNLDSEKLFLDFIYILRNDDGYLSFAVCWSLVWIYTNSSLKLDEIQYNILIKLLINKWLFTDVYFTSRFASWILTEIMSPTVNISFLGNEIPGLNNLILERFNNPRNDFEKYSALYVGINISANLRIEDVQEALIQCDQGISNSNKRHIIYANFLDLNINVKNLEMDEEIVD